MFDVTIKNNYVHPIRVDGDQNVYKPGGTYQFPHMGTRIINVPGMGDIHIIDIAERKLDAYTSEKIPWTRSTWGGLVRYRGLDAYFRYEGAGHFTITIDRLGSIDIHFDQGGMILNIEDMTVS
jgi:hypothetical protein